jgi:hypothetical protein
MLIIIHVRRQRYSWAQIMLSGDYGKILVEIILSVTNWFMKTLHIFGPKRDEVTGGWRKLHNEELRNLYSSPSKIRMIK